MGGIGYQRSQEEYDNFPNPNSPARNNHGNVAAKVGIGLQGDLGRVAIRTELAARFDANSHSHIQPNDSYFTDVLPRFAGGVASPFNRSAAGVVLRTYSVTGPVPPAVPPTVFHLLQVAGVPLTWTWSRPGAPPPARRAPRVPALRSPPPPPSPRPRYRVSSSPDCGWVPPCSAWWPHRSRRGCFPSPG